MFKAQILAKLVAKYPGLPKSFLGTIAEKAKVTEESQIEGFINGLEQLPISIEDLAAEFQKEGDRRATEGVEAYKKKNPNPNDPPKPDPKNPPPPKPEEDETAKLLREMREELNAMKTEKTVGTLRDQLNAKLAEKKIPVLLAKNLQLTPESNLDELVAALEADHKELMQNTITTNIKSNILKPGGGGGSGDDAKTASSDAIKAFTAKLNEKAEAAKK